MPNKLNFAAASFDIAEAGNTVTISIDAGAALTAADASTVDATYGTEEAAVINNIRTRLNELENRLVAMAVLTA